MELCLAFLMVCFQEKSREIEGRTKKVTVIIVDKDAQKAQLGIGM